MADKKDKILIADDMETFLRLEKMLLERSGYDIIMAKTGGEAIKKIQMEKPSLVFLDMLMPDMNGDAVCRFVKTNKSLKDIPVIMVSTKSEPEYRDRCFQAGCDDYVTKPVTQRDLFDKIKKFVRVERRDHPRAELKVTATTTGESFTSENFTQDVSEGGIFVETETMIPAGTDLELEFTLPDAEKPVTASGKVVRTVTADQAGGSRAGLGVKFTIISPEDSTRIKNYVENNA
ncbi:MAG: TIGR02266 family protein [bacterium]